MMIEIVEKICEKRRKRSNAESILFYVLKSFGWWQGSLIEGEVDSG